jgi:hypothetical protein
MYKAMRVVLPGDLWLISTPRSKRGLFYETFVNGGERWLKVSVPATECPRIPPELLAWKLVGLTLAGLSRN